MVYVHECLWELLNAMKCLCQIYKAVTRVKLSNSNSNISTMMVLFPNFELNVTNERKKMILSWCLTMQEMPWSWCKFKAVCIIPQESNLSLLNNPLWFSTITAAVFSPVQHGCEMLPCTGCSCVLAVPSSWSSSLRSLARGIKQKQFIFAI